MRKGRIARKLPVQPIAFVRGEAFDTETVVRLLSSIGLPSHVSTTWLRESLNEVCRAYFANFAVDQASAASEQAEWLADLATACATLGQMLSIPDRPRQAHDRVYTALFHHGELHGCRAALDAAPGIVWDLHRAAQFAFERWRAEVATSKATNTADMPILNWIGALSFFYERTFGTRAPTHPTPTSPLTQFADAVRHVAMQRGVVKVVTDQGTNKEACERLARLTPQRFARYTQDNHREIAARVEVMRQKEFEPHRIALGTLPDIRP